MRAQRVFCFAGVYEKLAQKGQSRLVKKLEEHAVDFSSGEKQKMDCTVGCGMHRRGIMRERKIGGIMSRAVIRYAEREELDDVNVIRKEVNELHVKGCSDMFREDGWQFIEPFIYTRFDAENSGVLVAILENEIVGFAVVQYIIRPESPFGRERRYYHIEELGGKRIFESLGYKTL